MEHLTKNETDILGEISNISIGNAATTLSMMVNHTVNITTPRVEVIERRQALDDYEKTCVFVQIHYIKGLSGNNVFVLKERDVMCLTDLMMGGSGLNNNGAIGELQISAISEAMNQMMGAAATSMATMLDDMVDISTPDVSSIDVESVKKFENMFSGGNDAFVKVAFVLDIEDIMESVMVQLYPLDFAKKMVNKFKVKKTQ